VEEERRMGGSWVGGYVECECLYRCASAQFASKIAVGVATTLIVDAITGELVEDPDADPTAEPAAEEPAATLCVCSVTEGDRPVKH